MAATDPKPVPRGVVRVAFASKSGLPEGHTAASINETLGWVSFLKGSSGQCGEEDSCGGAPWAEQQVAEFYLRSAELFGERGAAGARRAIEHVGYALSSGAAPERAHMLRASAHLVLDKIPECKDDVTAVLATTPEHKAAVAFRRRVEQYSAATTAAAQSAKSKQWAAALEHYTSALEALSPELVTTEMATATLRSGLCSVHLRLRAYQDAVTWCGRAHGAENANVDALFRYADARSAAGEEHAALQL